jgi:hypothetical protein
MFLLININQMLAFSERSVVTFVEKWIETVPVGELLVLSVGHLSS